MGNFFNNQYFKAILIVLIFFLISKTIAFFTDKYLSKKFDYSIIKKLKKPFVNIIVLLGLQVALGQIESPYLWLEQLTRSILILFLIYVAITAINSSFKFWLERFKIKNQSKTIDSLSPLFKKTVIIALLISGVLWILQVWGINIGPLLAGLGIAGFVIGFAMQDSLKNIFGGIALILDDTLMIGGRVSLEGGDLGIVEAITIRSTKIRTFDNEILTIPNGRLSEMKIKNFNQPNSSLRVIVNFSTAYGSDTDKVKRVVLSSINKIEGIKEDPVPDAIMIEMADSGLNWQARFWVEDQSTAYTKKIELLEIIYKDFLANGINIPFPTRTIYSKKDESSN